MADLRRMTLQSLRALARRKLGAGAARLTTKEALVRALAVEKGGAKAEKAAPVGRRKAAAKPRPVKESARTPAKKAAKARPVKKPARTPAAAKGPGRARVAAKRKAAAPAAATSRPGAKARKPAPRVPATRPSAGNGEGAMDPAGFFVARVRGEGAVREAPHPMSAARSPGAGARVPAQQEELGELPASYGEDTLVLLPRDPTSLFVYWDQSETTVRQAFRELEGPRVQLWLWAQAGDGWELCRRVDLALEARGWYVHGLEPGRSYRAELRAVDAAGRERAIGPGSGLAGLPPGGPSPFVDDRFVRLDWDQPLGAPLGPGTRGTEFSTAAREQLARRSGWVEEARPTSERPQGPDHARDAREEPGPLTPRRPKGEGEP